MAKVIYEIEMNAENAPMIDQVNRLLLGEGYTEETAAKTPSNKGADKAESKAESKAEEPASKGDTDTMSLSAFKTAVKKAKAEHGEDFVKSCLESGGGKAGDPLGRMVSAIDADEYADIVATFLVVPAEQAEEDDGLEDEEEDSSEVTADAVKVAAKAYAKEVGRDEAKEIMNSNGAATLTKIADCTAKQLPAMFKAFTA